MHAEFVNQRDKFSFVVIRSVRYEFQVDRIFICNLGTYLFDCSAPGDFFYLGGFLLRKKQAIRGSAVAPYLRYASERLRRPYYPCHGLRN